MLFLREMTYILATAHSCTAVISGVREQLQRHIQTFLLIMDACTAKVLVYRKESRRILQLRELN